MQIPPQIQSLFERFPMLAGFSVREAREIPDHCVRSGEEGELFVGDLGISPGLSQRQLAEMLEEITAALAELISDEPDGGEGLRGRTFARVLH